MSWFDDLTHAWRRLRQRPALTIVAVATLALGLGANIAIFTLIHALAIQALPVREPHQPSVSHPSPSTYRPTTSTRWVWLRPPAGSLNRQTMRN